MDHSLLIRQELDAFKKKYQHLINQRLRASSGKSFRILDAVSMFESKAEESAQVRTSGPRDSIVLMSKTNTSAFHETRAKLVRKTSSSSSKAETRAAFNEPVTAPQVEANNPAKIPGGDEYSLMPKKLVRKTSSSSSKAETQAVFNEPVTVEIEANKPDGDEYSLMPKKLVRKTSSSSSKAETQAVFNDPVTAENEAPAKETGEDEYSLMSKKLVRKTSLSTIKAAFTRRYSKQPSCDTPPPPDSPQCFTPQLPDAIEETDSLASTLKADSSAEMIISQPREEPPPKREVERFSVRTVETSESEDDYVALPSSLGQESSLSDEPSIDWNTSDHEDQVDMLESPKLSQQQLVNPKDISPKPKTEAAVEISDDDFMALMNRMKHRPKEAKMFVLGGSPTAGSKSPNPPQLKAPMPHEQQGFQHGPQQVQQRQAPVSNPPRKEQLKAPMPYEQQGFQRGPQQVQQRQAPVQQRKIPSRLVVPSAPQYQVDQHEQSFENSSDAVKANAKKMWGFIKKKISNGKRPDFQDNMPITPAAEVALLEPVAANYTTRTISEPASRDNASRLKVTKQSSLSDDHLLKMLQGHSDEIQRMEQIVGALERGFNNQISPPIAEKIGHELQYLYSTVQGIYKNGVAPIDGNNLVVLEKKMITRRVTILLARLEKGIMFTSNMARANAHALEG